MAAGTYHVREIGGNQAGLVYTLVGVAFVQFICILFCRAYIRLHTLDVWKKIPKHNSKYYVIANKWILKCTEENGTDRDGPSAKPSNKQDMEIAPAPTTTFIELRESLIES